MRLDYFSRLTVLLGVVALVGCGGSESTGSTLEGNVTLNGQPIGVGVINFDPQQTGSTAVATIQEDGSYEARMSRSLVGIEPGTYSVRIEAWKYPPGAFVDGKEYVNGVSAVPPEYQPGGAKALTVTIEKDTAHEVDFEMQGESEDAATVETEAVPEGN